MSKIIRTGKRKSKEYWGLSQKEWDEADAFLNELTIKVSKFENELQEQNESRKTVLYHWKIGEFLCSVVDQADIPAYERQYLWEEIKNFCLQEEQTIGNKDRSKARSYYEYCYLMYRIDPKYELNLNWDKWQTLLDRYQDVNEDQRVIKWIALKNLSRNEFRLFAVFFHVYISNHDTTVFEDDEVIVIYEKLFKCSKTFKSLCETYLTENNNSKRANNAILKNRREFAKQAIKAAITEDDDLKMNSVLNELFLKLFNK